MEDMETPIIIIIITTVIITENIDNNSIIPMNSKNNIIHNKSTGTLSSASFSHSNDSWISVFCVYICACSSFTDAEGAVP
jgi:hypothetical protein